MVILKYDHMSRICYDLFGNLVVVTLRNYAEPIRLATLTDKRNAAIMSPEVERKIEDYPCLQNGYKNGYDYGKEI